MRALPTPDDSAGSSDRYAESALPPEAVAAIDDELDDDPATDPEALLVCALMWSDHTGGVATEDRRITTVLTVEDFESPAYGQLFATVAQLIAAGDRYDPASVAAALGRSGADGAKDAPLRRRLNEVITAGADGFNATHYAGLVLSQSYRRGFYAAGTAITQASREIPEEDLMEHMVHHGRRRRAALRRLTSFRNGGTETVQD